MVAVVKKIELRQYEKAATRKDPTRTSYQVLKARNLLNPTVGAYLSAQDVQDLISQGIDVQITDPKLRKR